MDPLARELLAFVLFPISWLVTIAFFVHRTSKIIGSGGFEGDAPSHAQQHLYLATAEAAALSSAAIGLAFGVVLGAPLAVGLLFVGGVATTATRPAHAGLRSPTLTGLIGLTALVSIVLATLVFAGWPTKFAVSVCSGVVGHLPSSLLCCFFVFTAPVALFDLIRRPHSRDGRLLPRVGAGYVTRWAISFALGALLHWSLTGPRSHVL